MKLRNYFFAGLAVCAFAACSNDDEPQGSDNGQATSLSIQVIEPTSKAADPNATAEESTLTTLDVAVFTAGGQFAAKKHVVVSDQLEDKTIYFDTTAGLKAGTSYQVIVLANTAAPAENTIAAYKALLSNLNIATTDNEFIMSGMNTTAALAAVSDNSTAETTPNQVTVPVARIASKVQLSSLAVDFSAEALAAGAESFTVKQVYLINATDKSLVYNGDNTSSVYYSAAGFEQGCAATSEPLFAGHLNNATQNTTFLNTIDADNVIANKGTKNALYSSYVLANEHASNQTYLIIDGTVGFTVESATQPKDVFYKVLLKDSNDAAAAARVLRNKIYKIDAKISGIKGGQDAADLVVTVSVDNWTVINLTPDLE